MLLLRTTIEGVTPFAADAILCHAGARGSKSAAGIDAGNVDGVTK